MVAALKQPMLFPTLVIEQDPWSVVYHASTGRSYIVKLVMTTMAERGREPNVMLPVALVEHDDLITAHFADPRITEIFTGITEMADRYASYVTDFTSRDGD